MNTIGVLTSGGDAPGMNAAVRAVVRCALEKGVSVYAIYEGYRGMIQGNEWIKPLKWNSVGGILHKGGTMIGSARCQEFLSVEGRQKAVKNLIDHGIGGLVVIGGDGSLTGANILRQEWNTHLQSLLEDGKITEQQARDHHFIGIVGLVGSIDNDMFGTDITIGADTALHRITEAVDAISSTAASHQRAFVIEVMGRNAGYLAMMSALASGADWALIPENPPDLEEWEAKMCEVLSSGRQGGRRDSIVIVAEGAVDHKGNPVTCEYVKQVLEERLNEDTRITILGHVQRGGSPSAFDRNLSLLLGAAAVDQLLELTAESPSYLLGMQGNRVVSNPLMECVAQTQAVNEAISDLNFERAMELRGSNFRESFRTLRTLVRAIPHEPDPNKIRRRFAILNAGAPAPGMNTSVRAAVRIGLDKGHHMWVIYDGFRGLRDGRIKEFDWMSVNGWAPMGGSELGTNRMVPEKSDFYAMARNIEEHQIDGLLVIGGWAGYAAALRLYDQRQNFPAFEIPIVCLPASINNNLPGTELCVGADTALNSIVEAVDKIKQSAVASNRCFIVEVMGRYCGYLALMSALASGAERVYIHEEGITLKDLQEDVELLVEGFSHGKRLGVMIRNENANEIYDTEFIRSLLEEEGGDLFEVRQSILGHLQQGGNPSPFDRVLATRYAVGCVDFLEQQLDAATADTAGIGLLEGEYQLSSFDVLRRLFDEQFQRPKEQWWMNLRPLVRVLAQPDAQYFVKNQR